jgi:tRNA threonylcarbamoyladenosine biosynthesis protein TsaE
MMDKTFLKHDLPIPPEFLYDALPYQYRVPLVDDAATQQLGRQLAVCVSAGFLLYLQGDLGAGKTTLTRALLRELGVTGTLRSPSYALLEPYEVACLEAEHPHQGALLHHFDFYRLDSQPLAWKEAGFYSAFESPHAAIVEWPQYAHGLPAPHIGLYIQHDGLSRIAYMGSQCVFPIKT